METLGATPAGFRAEPRPPTISEHFDLKNDTCGIQMPYSGNLLMVVFNVAEVKLRRFESLVAVDPKGEVCGFAPSQGDYRSVGA